jgi:hypothetical protein
VYCGEILAMIGEARDLMLQDRAEQLLRASKFEDILAFFISDHSYYLLEKIVSSNKLNVLVQDSEAMKLLQQAFPSIKIEIHLLGTPNSDSPEDLLEKHLKKKFKYFQKIQNLDGCEEVYLKAYQYRFYQHFAPMNQANYAKAIQAREALCHALQSLVTSSEEIKIFEKLIYHNFLGY